MTWLVTGGAGYIGASVVRLLHDAGESAVVLDDFSTGLAHRVPRTVPVVRASILDYASVRRALEEHEVDGVIHLAARKSVAESVARPLSYYRHNVEGTSVVLSAMSDTGVRRIVFSSSAAVYGAVDGDRVDETHVPQPVNPYGQTKLVGEWMVTATAPACGFGAVSLRYFNVAGAVSPELGDVGEENLLPRVLDRLEAGRAVPVFGGDWPTPDGTCIRDYVHVCDLATAHLVALRRTAQLDGAAETYNVGTGRGSSVLDVVAAAARVVGVRPRVDVVDRRPGDPARVVADASLLRERLGWSAEHDLDDIVASAWRAREVSAPAAGSGPRRSGGPGR